MLGAQDALLGKPNLKEELADELEGPAAIKLGLQGQARGRSGEKLPHTRMETPEEELSRVESLDVRDHSSFVGHEETRDLFS